MIKKFIKMKSKSLSLIILLFVSMGLNAQVNTPGWNWPEDRQTAEEKNVLYTDQMKLGNYKQATKPLHWLMVNAPDLNKSIYINGAKIYESLAESEQDPELQEIYQDSCLLMYDLRIKYFNEEASVLNRKAFVAYKFEKEEKDSYKELYELFNQAFETNKNEIWDNNLLAYMDVVRRYKLSGGEITDEEVLDRYNVITEIIEAKKSEGKNVDRLEGIGDQVDKMLSATIDVDCDFIQNNLGPKLDANPDDLKMAKNIFKLSYAGKCLDIPVFLKAIKIVYSQEPTYGLARLIGDRSYLNEDWNNALKYYAEAIKLTDDNTKRADLYLRQGDIYQKLGDKPQARNMARKALGEDPSMNEAYMLIGNLYYTSFNECKMGENRVEDRAVYFAAYEYYRKAGNREAMQNARDQFPTMEEIFTYDMEVGQTIKCGCWINEVVTIQRRD